MENTGIRGPKDTTLNLRHIEAFVFFAAMLLAITQEGACVYWLWLPGTTRAYGATSSRPSKVEIRTWGQLRTAESCGSTGRPAPPSGRTGCSRMH